MLMRTLDTFILLLSTLLFASTVSADITAARQTELLYFVKHDCGSCHGLNMKGGLGPALLPQTLSAKPESYLVTTILEGRENTAMPPWNTMLTREDARWISQQLKSGSIIETAIAERDTSKLDSSNSNDPAGKP